MQSLKIITLSFFTLFCLNSSCQSWDWAKSSEGSGSTKGQGVSADKYGNSYVLGTYYDNVQFDNNVTITSQISGWDRFIAKYDNLGNIVWANSLNQNVSGSSLYGESIGVDAMQNCYVIGEFSDSLNIGGSFITTTSYLDTCFDFSTGQFLPCTLYYRGIHMTKFDQNGNLVWLKKIGESKEGGLLASAISFDNSGNCLITGGFRKTITFNNNANFVANGGLDIFIAKINSTGDVQWANQAGGTDINGDYSRDIAVDGLGNSLITGTFRGTATFDTFTLSSSNLGMYVAKYNDSGNCLWAEQIDGIGESKSIAVDQNGNCFITGYFNTPQAVFDNITLTNTNIGGDIFIAKYSTSGNCLWAKNIDGVNIGDEGNSVAVDIGGNCFVTGSFSDQAVFDSVTLTSEVLDIFVAKYDSIGNLNWVVKAGGSYTDIGSDLVLDGKGNILVTGLFSQTVVFGSDSIVKPITSSSHFFIAKLIDPSGIITDQIELSTTGNWSIYPNPLTNSALLTFDNSKTRNCTMILYDIQGRPVRTLKNITTNSIEIKRENLTSGSYFVHIYTKEEILVRGKLIVN